MNNTIAYDTPFAPLNSCQYSLSNQLNETTEHCSTAYEFEQTVNGKVPYKKSTNDHMLCCTGCKLPISDRYLLSVAGYAFHEVCLKCNECYRELSLESTCFFRAGKVLCKVDYERLFMVKCSRCFARIKPSDMIHRIGNEVFHLTCFTCTLCRKQFLPGDEYVHHDGQLMCRVDFESYLSNPYIEPFQFNYSQEAHRKAVKRPRTILTNQQRKVFKASFEVSAKPCRKVREALAKETGLSVRVVQVWFQNQRAKMKKMHRSANGKKSQAQGAGESKQTKAKLLSKEFKNNQSKTTSSVSDVESLDDTENSYNLLDSPASDESSVDEHEETSQLDDEKGIAPSSSPNTAVSKSSPIDRLYLMQNSYFSY